MIPIIILMTIIIGVLVYLLVLKKKTKINIPKKKNIKNCQKNEINVNGFCKKI